MNAASTRPLCSGRILPVALLLVMGGISCARLVSAGESRETLEFRLVRPTSTLRVNRSDYDGLRRLVSIYRRPDSTEADLTRELLTMEKRAELGGDRLFLSWGGAGPLSSPQELVVLGPPLMNCEDLAQAESRTTRGFGGLVYLRFTEAGARRMRSITAENIGGQLAIVWRRRVLASPTIEQPIPNGRAVISNIQTVREAQSIAQTIAACIPPGNARRTAAR